MKPYYSQSGITIYTEKPVQLLRELIESSSRIGDLVLDPFVGCGSTLVAARLEGRLAIGIEIEGRYCEIAAKRLQQALPLDVANRQLGLSEPKTKEDCRCLIS